MEYSEFCDFSVLMIYLRGPGNLKIVQACNVSCLCEERLLRYCPGSENAGANLAKSVSILSQTSGQFYI